MYLLSNRNRIGAELGIMFIDIDKIQVDNSKFKPTANINTNNEIGQNGCISPEFLTILIHLKGGRILYKGYSYFAINSGSYIIVLREKHG